MPTRAICAVCREYLFNEGRIDVLSCGHVYHHECITRCINRVRGELRNGLCPYCRLPIGPLRQIFVTLEDLPENASGSTPMNVNRAEMVTSFEQLRSQLDAAITTLRQALHTTNSNQSSPVLIPRPMPNSRSIETPVNATSRDFRRDQVINIPLPTNNSNRGQNRLHFEVQNGQLMVRISRR